MNEEKNVWRSFQGCVITVMPLVVSTLLSVAAYRFLERLQFPLFVVASSAVVVWMLAFMVTYTIRKNLGD